MSTQVYLENIEHARLPRMQNAKQLVNTLANAIQQIRTNKKIVDEFVYEHEEDPQVAKYAKLLRAIILDEL